MPYQKKMSDALYRVEQKISNEWKTFFSHVELQQVFGAIQISKPHVSVTTSSFPAKKFKQKIPRSKKDKAQFVFILEFFWVEVAFLESQDHYLQNLEKRSVVVQVAL